MRENKTQKQSGKAILLAVQKEMAKPRMAKSTRGEQPYREAKRPSRRKTKP
jgi:hypothetical protein